MLIGRDEHFSKIRSMIVDSLLAKKAKNEEGKPLSLYISGAPGTGKTATVDAVIQNLNANKEFKKKLKVVSVNCLASSISDSQSKFMMEIAQKLDEKAAKQMSSRNVKRELEEFLSACKISTLIILDEIDTLTKKSFSILYTLFNWPWDLKGKVAVIGIANSLGLTEREMSALKFRNKPETLVFEPYTGQQIAKILEQYLSEKYVKDYDQKAIELCAKKVSTMTGDIRRAFNIASEILVYPEQDESPIEASEEENMAKIQENRKKREKTPPRRALKRPNQEELNLTPKKNACVEVLNSIKKVYASPCRRSNLTEQQRIVLGTLMRLVDCRSNVNVNKAPESGSSSCSISVSRDQLYNAYQKVCAKLDLKVLNNEELEMVYSHLEAQAMIQQVSRGQSQMISFGLDQSVARQVINDHALIANIENIYL